MLEEFKEYLEEILNGAGYYDSKSGVEHVNYDVVEILRKLEELEAKRAEQYNL